MGKPCANPAPRRHLLVTSGSSLAKLTRLMRSRMRRECAGRRSVRWATVVASRARLLDHGGLRPEMPDPTVPRARGRVPVGGLATAQSRIGLGLRLECLVDAHGQILAAAWRRKPGRPRNRGAWDRTLRNEQDLGGRPVRDQLLHQTLSVHQPEFYVDKEEIDGRRVILGEA